MPQKTISDWEAKGWTRLDVIPDVDTDVAYDPTSQDLVLKGQVFGTDGKQLRGRARPKLTTVETDDGCSITASEPATVLYKIVAQEGDEAET